MQMPKVPRDSKKEMKEEETYSSLIERLEQLCEADAWKVPASAVAKLITVLERTELGRHGSASFVAIERHAIFPFLELPASLQVHVLSQLESHDMPVAAQICTVCRDAVLEATRARAWALGARRIPPLFDGESLTHALHFVEKFQMRRCYGLNSWAEARVSVSATHVVYLEPAAHGEQWRSTVSAFSFVDAHPPGAPDGLELPTPPAEASPSLFRAASFFAHLGGGEEIARRPNAPQRWATPNPDHDLLPALALPPDAEPHFVSVAAGCVHSLALNDAGEVWSCGCGALLGRIATNRVPLADGEALPGITIEELATGDFRVNGPAEDQSRPGRVFFNRALTQHFRIVQIACGAYHSLCVTDGGDVYGWGCDTDGQVTGSCLDEDSQSVIRLPRKIDRPCKQYQDQSVVSVAAGARHSAALTWDGSLFTWGGGFRYYNETRPLPYAALGIDGALHSRSGGQQRMQPVMGEAFKLALLEQRHESKRDRARSRMSEADKAAGLTPAHVRFSDHAAMRAHLASFESDTEDEPLPEAATVFADACSCGWNHTLVVTDDGKLFAFGENAHGECGLGGEASHVPERRTHTPTRVNVDPKGSLRNEEGELCDLNYRILQVSAGKYMSIMLSVHFEVFVCGLTAPPGTAPTSSRFKVFTQPTRMDEEEEDEIMEVRAGAIRVAVIRSHHDPRNHKRWPRGSARFERLRYSLRDEQFSSWADVPVWLEGTTSQRLAGEAAAS